MCSVNVNSFLQSPVAINTRSLIFKNLKKIFPIEKVSIHAQVLQLKKERPVRCV